MPGPGFEKCMDEFFGRRLETPFEALSEKVSGADFKLRRVQERLLGLLPKDEKLEELVREFKDANNEAEAERIEVAYQRGFSDGVRFIIHAVSLGA